MTNRLGESNVAYRLAFIHMLIRMIDDIMKKRDLKDCDMR